MQPEISVIIPNKNCIEYLPIAIESIWQQELENIEVIIIDDNSTDTSWEWICNLAKEHKNVVAVKVENLGCSGARNHAARIAKGKYLAFLDADDYWQAGKLKLQLAEFKKNENVGLCFTNYDHITEDKKIIIDCFSYWQQFNEMIQQYSSDSFLLPQSAVVIFSENVVGTSTVMVDRNVFLAVKGFDTNLKSSSDWDLWLKIALRKDVVCINKTLVYYLMREGAMTKNRTARLNAMKQIIHRYEHKISSLDPTAVRAAYGRLSEAYGEYFREINKPVKAFRSDLDSIMKQPDKRRVKNLLSDVRLMVQL